MTATLLLRLPEDLKERLRRAAYERHESQNAIVVAALRNELMTEDEVAEWQRKTGITWETGI